ncbi:MAG: dienelactone hydrolase family protein [Hyphomicrobiales bacterium]
MSQALLDGPRLPPVSGGPAKQLVVFLHGYGADGNDLIGIGREWAAHLPDAAFVSPHAPEPCGMAPVGRQWFHLTLRDPSEYWRGVTAARPSLDAFLNAELKSLELTDKDLVLVGFSQGTMMALHVGLRRDASPAGIVGYSGLLAGPENLEADIKGRPPVFLAHGTHDEVVPHQMMTIAENSLKAAKVPVSSHSAQGMGHGIDGAGLTLGLDHIKKCFAL